MPTSSPTPLATGDILPRRTPYATWPASLALLATVTLYVGGLVVWNNATPSGPPVAADTPVTVGRGVAYVPARGWSLDAPAVKPGEAHGVRAGAATFRVSIARWKGSERGPVERAERLALLAGEPRHLGRESVFTTPSGLSGTVVDVFGDTIHGRLWVVVDAVNLRTIVMQGEATPDQFRRHEPTLQAMVESVVAGAPK